MAEESFRVLIVEDDEGNALLEMEAINGHFRDCSIDIARDGAECMRLLGQKEYDIILLDQGLPDIRGLSLFEKYRKAGYDIPTVMVTGTGNEEIAVEAVRLGAYDYIIKTVDLGYLKTLPLAVQKSIARRQMEQEVQRARAKEIELERLRAVREIAVSLSHEINNPLCAILGTVQLVLSHSQQFDEDTVDDLKIIEQQTKRIKELMARLRRIDHLYTTTYLKECSMIDIAKSAGGDLDTPAVPRHDEGKKRDPESGQPEASKEIA